MGYSHVFETKRNVPVQQWVQITDAFKKVVLNLPEFSQTAGSYYPDVPIKLQYECDEDKAVVIDNDIIRFNGDGENGHETFLLCRAKFSNETFYDFCKTNRKPYDFAVCAALILTDHYAPGCYRIVSDGTAEEWMPALLHLRKILEMPNLQLPVCFNDGLSEGDRSTPTPEQYVATGVFRPDAEWF